MKKRSRLDSRIEEFRTWWVGLDQLVRKKNEDRLRQMGELAQSIIADAAGDDFGPKFIAVLLEAGKGFFLFGKTPAELLLAVKRQLPEVWPLIGPFLPADVAAEIEVLEHGH